MKPSKWVSIPDELKMVLRNRGMAMRKMGRDIIATIILSRAIEMLTPAHTDDCNIAILNGWVIDRESWFDAMPH
jgi:hypothetical protein